MSRRPPSARDPRNAGVTRTIPAVNRTTKGASASRLASPLSRSLRGSQPVAGGGDSDHVGAGTDSTAVGVGATSVGYQSAAVGAYAEADQDAAAAFGRAAAATAIASTAIGTAAVAVATDATALGVNAGATAIRSTALGRSASADGARSLALGYGATASADDTGVAKVNTLELVRSSGTGETGLILHDSSGARWKVTVDTTGHLTTTAL